MPKDRIAPVDLRFFLKIDTIDSLSSIFRSVDHKKKIDSIEKPIIVFPTLKFSKSNVPPEAVLGVGGEDLLEVVEGPGLLKGPQLDRTL